MQFGRDVLAGVRVINVSCNTHAAKDVLKVLSSSVKRKAGCLSQSGLHAFILPCFTHVPETKISISNYCTVLAMCVSTGSHPGIQESRCLMPSLCELKVAASIAVHPPKSHAQHGNQYLHCWKRPWTILSLSLCQFDMGILEQILLYFFLKLNLHNLLLFLRSFFFRWGHLVFYPQAWKTIPNPVDTRCFEVLCFDHVLGRMVEMSSCLQGLRILSVTVQMFETPFSMVMVEVSNVPSHGESIVTFSHWLTPGNECLCGFPIWKGPAAFSVLSLGVPCSSAHCGGLRIV